MVDFLVLGANSFSGSHFVRRILQEGHSVVGSSRRDSHHKVFLPYLWMDDYAGKFEFRRMNVNEEPAILEKLIEATRPSVVVNFAAQGMVAESWSTPWDWFNTNTVGLSRVAAALMDSPGLKRYIHVSTPEVYGSTEGWVKETNHFAPSTPYATSRAAGDWHIMNLWRSKGFPGLITRSANVYGEGQQLYRIIPRAMMSALTSEQFPLHGSGLSRRSFIHIEDVVQATYLLAIEGEPGETYHISTNDLIAIRDLVSMIASRFGRSISELSLQTSDRVGKDAAYKLDSSKLRQRFGWSDQVNLDQGLGRVESWIADNLDVLRALPRAYEHLP